MLRNTLKLRGVPRGDARNGEMSSPMLRKLLPIPALRYLVYLVVLFLEFKEIWVPAATQLFQGFEFQPQICCELRYGFSKGGRQSFNRTL